MYDGKRNLAFSSFQHCLICPEVLLCKDFNHYTMYLAISKIPYALCILSVKRDGQFLIFFHSRRTIGVGSITVRQSSPGFNRTRVICGHCQRSLLVSGTH